MPKADILGVKVDSLTREEVLEQVRKFIWSDKTNYIVTPNPEFVLAAQKDDEFRNILNQADLTIPDGFGLKVASYILVQKIKDKVSGADLMFEIIKLVHEKNLKLGLVVLGEGFSRAEEIVNQLRLKYQGLQVEAVEISINDLNNQEVVDKVNGWQPEVIFVGLGQVKQEKWIARNINSLPGVKLLIGLGGSFDYITKKKKRAPKFFRALQLEWFWRLIIQPNRFGRIFNATFKFIYLVLKSRPSNKKEF